MPKVASFTEGVTSAGTSCRNGYINNCSKWILDHDNVDYLHCAVTEDNPTCN